MNRLLVKCLAGLVLPLAAADMVRAAETYPVRPVHVIVASAPGGSIDIIARMVAQKMSETLGQAVVVENRSGADTLIGVRYVKNAAPDGYTLLATTSTITMQPAVKLDPGYDLMKDFVGVGMMTRAPWMMVVGPNQPYKTLADFIAIGKTHPETLSFASGGIGTSPYMGAASFLQRAGLNILHVPYRGNGPAMPDVMAGRVGMMFDGVPSSAALMRGGQLRALGVTSTKRLAIFPDVPTLAEQGLPGFSSYFFTALFAPAGTQPEAVKRLSESMRAATKELSARFEADGAETPSLTPEEFDASLRKDLADVTKLADELGLKKE